jgi:hypothetical protein
MFLKNVFENHRNESANTAFSNSKSFFAWLDNEGKELVGSQRASATFDSKWTTHAMMRLPTAVELRQTLISNHDGEKHYDDVFDSLNTDLYIPKQKKEFKDLIEEFDVQRREQNFSFMGIATTSQLTPTLHSTHLDCEDKIVDHRFLRDVPEAHKINIPVLDGGLVDADNRSIVGNVTNHEMNRAVAESFNSKKSIVTQLDNLFAKAAEDFSGKLKKINEELANVDHVDAYRALVGRELERRSSGLR